MANLYRCVILSIKNKYYVGKDYNGNKFRIKKNKNLKDKNIGDDFYFYAKKLKGIFRDTLIPVSNEEAGVSKMKIK